MGGPYQDGDTLRRLYKGEQLSINEISDKFGVSYSTIYRWLDRHGIERRSFGEHQTPIKLRDPDYLVRKHHGDGLTIRDIAEEVGCSEQTVSRAFKRHNIENKRSSKLPHPASKVLNDADELERLYHDEFMSQREIAEMLDVDQGTVSRWLDRHGIESHSRSEYSGKRHPRYNPESRYHVYNADWRDVREDVIQRDGEQCVECGITREEHQAEYDMDLDVHHIVPQYKADDKYEKENLITMCRSCHTKVEQRENEGAA